MISMAFQLPVRTRRASKQSLPALGLQPARANLARTAARWLTVLVAPLLLTLQAHAATWPPNQPVRMVVPFAVGGAGDTIARLFGEKLATALGQPVVVDNRGGAGGIIGMDLAAKSAADGYTMLLADPSLAISPSLVKTTFDPVKDFTPISLLASSPMVLVINPQRVQAANIRELIALAKTNPGKYSVASSGNGSIHHLAAERFKHDARVSLLHIPYRGQAAAVADVVGGQVDMLFSTLVAIAPHLKSGKLKALAVTTPQRVAELPDLPTLAESGIAGFDVGTWISLYYPANTPKAIVDQVNAELNKILQMPDVKARLGTIGYTVDGGTPDVLARRLQKDLVTYRQTIKEAGIKAD